MITRADTTVVLDDILHQLTEIRNLLASMHAWAIEQRKIDKADAERQYLDVKSHNEIMVESAKEQYLQAARQMEAEHIAMFHTRNRGGAA